MAKILLNKLNLENKINTSLISIGDQEIEVVQYLPLKDKLDLIQIVIEESSAKDEVFCNPVLVDILFHTYMVLTYTNITLNKTQKTNIIETYDILESNGVIDKVIQAIPEREYADLVDSLNKCVEKVEKENASIITLIKNAIEKTTTMIESAKNDLGSVNLNSENIQNILAIAKDNGAI